MAKLATSPLTISISLRYLIYCTINSSPTPCSLSSAALIPLEPKSPTSQPSQWKMLDPASHSIMTLQSSTQKPASALPSLPPSLVPIQETIAS